ncbi:hypothetical protein [Micromonospora yangpuensis]|uniref:Uncharacterized protein n=1 Tax=Micromonospora yangpuensis TaxID=683228 RepID=A0A1C6VDR8_9ACTN|nr:hypothetical protein [Micromonospora yangpuensis]GGM14131.1 hypothetical protein GCM10012279_35320 [Micromonospora yangpuensis]SCL64496.1 hypothetical protein GA0070617_5488 [Micromonospora yangpuensis]
MTTSRNSNPGDVGLVRGRESPQWTDVHDWVALSGVSPTAIALYVVLRMHVNRERGDHMVKTSMLTLAVLMGMSRGDKIKPYLDELVAIGAVDVDRGGLHRRNTYVVHQLPPLGYPGKITLKSWYNEHRALIALKRADEKAKRDARRAAAKAKGQVSAVTPETGEQAETAVTPGTGEQVTPESGEPVTPVSGREPDVLGPDDGEPPLPASSSDGQEEEETSPPAEGQPRPVDEALVKELTAARPDWSARSLRQVLADEAIQERRTDLVAAAFRSAAQDPKATTPRWLLHAPCPHWRRAAQTLGLLPTSQPAAGQAESGEDGRPVAGRTSPEQFAATSRRGRALVDAALAGRGAR